MEVQIWQEKQNGHGIEEEAEIVTMEDTIFMKMKNDLSFIIADSLNLYEHQSTFNPNLPLRGLLYFAQQYEGLVAARKDNIYGSKRIGLPTPQYVIFYNGADIAEDRMELYLSDAYPEGRGSGCLECRCELLNINRGHNPEILQRCRRLWEYSEFVSEIQKHLKEKKSLQESIQLAIDYCIDRNILRNILIKERTEVLHMLLTEYDEKEHMRALYREGREDGYAEGERAGFQKGEHAGFRKGEHAGFQKGEMAVLRNLIQIKLAKGKTPEVIADELEEDIDKVRQIMDDLRG